MEAINVDLKADVKQCADVSSSGELKQIVVPGHELECALCLKLLFDPITTPACGHSFCRECLSRAMKEKPNCPICRETLSLDPSALPTNSLLTHILSTYAKTHYQARKKECTMARRQRPNLHGMFFTDYQNFPGDKIRLHLYELRYRRLVLRALNGDRKFIVLRSGDQIGCVAKLNHSQSTPDGRFLIEAQIIHRCQIIKISSEANGYGLEVAETRLIQDKPPNNSETKAYANSMLEAVNDLREGVHEFYGAVGVTRQRRLLRLCGEAPIEDTEALCWWVCRCVTGQDHIKAACMETDNSRARVKMCRQMLKKEAENERSRDLWHHFAAGVVLVVGVLYSLSGYLF
ncbi:hypothetical protein AAMO2058_000058200 [Amorphochlora amoebiformis]